MEDAEGVPISVWTLGKLLEEATSKLSFLTEKHLGVGGHRSTYMQNVHLSYMFNRYFKSEPSYNHHWVKNKDIACTQEGPSFTGLYLDFYAVSLLFYRLYHLRMHHLI